MNRYKPDEIINLRPLTFLCGPNYDEKDKRDRRTILRKYLSNCKFDVTQDGKQYLIQPFALVIDNLFNNLELESTKNITLIEEIVAACSFKNYVFIDTMSTALELGLFANSYSQNKVTALLPKDYELFRPSIGYFVTQTVIKSQNISLCTYRNRRVNKIIKEEQGKKVLFENLIAFQNSNVPDAIKREITKDFNENINSFRISLAFTQNEQESNKIIFVVKENKIYFIIPPLILFYLVETYKEEKTIKTKLERYWGKYVCACRTDLIADYFLLKKERKEIVLDSPFKYRIEDVIDNMAYVIEAIKHRNTGYQQSFTRLKYSLFQMSWETEIKRFYELLGFTRKEYNSLQVLSNKIAKGIVSKNLIINNKKRKIDMYASNSEGFELRKFHVRLLEQLQKLIVLTEYSFAYKKSHSTIMCVEKHINSKYFLKIDIKNFFNSISKNEMNKIFKCHFCDKPEESYEQNLVQKKGKYRSTIIKSWDEVSGILDLCFVKGKLPLGLVSSPIMSNMYLDFFDKRFHEKYPELIYTRYSDDMLISSMQPIEYDQIIYYISNELKYLKLKINKEKLRKQKICNIGDHVKFLGLNIVLDGVNGNYITVGKKYIQAVCKKICAFEAGNKEVIQSELLGEIEYIKSVGIRDYAYLFKIYNIKTGKNLDICKIRNSFKY